MNSDEVWKSMSRLVPQEISSTFTLSCPDDAEHDLGNSLRFDDAGNPVGDANAINLITIRPGFQMLVTRTDPNYMPAFKFDIQDMPFAFSFCLSGNQEINFNRGNAKQSLSFFNERGVNSLVCLEQSSGYSRYLSGDFSCAVAILLRRDVKGS